jgi:hypothetical protein
MHIQPTTPIIIQIPDELTPETTVADVLLQSIGITGVFVVSALMAGLVIGGIFIWLKHFRSAS